MELRSRLENLEMRMLNNMEVFETHQDRETVHFALQIIEQQQRALKEIVEITQSYIEMNPAYSVIHKVAVNGMKMEGGHTD